MLNTKVQLIKSQFEQKIDNGQNNKFVLKRSATSIESDTFKSSRQSHPIVSSRTPKQISVANFQRSKTSIDLRKSSDNDKCITDKIRTTSVILSRQLSDPVKKGNIKRTPAFRCEKVTNVNETKAQSNLSSKIRMFEQCQTKTRYSENKTDNCNISNSPTKYKSNHLLKKELDIISKRTKQLSPDSSSRSSSNSPIFNANNIPEYSQINKSNKTKFKTSINENLTDSLKKALKSPLPNGPPPKKPPRTFAHSLKTENNSNKLLDTGQSVKSKTDPRLMLDKLETALLQNKIRSPRSRRNILDIENIKTNLDFSTFNKPINNKNCDQNGITHKNGLFFNDCFPICATTSEYAKPIVSKSEFFVKPEHIYAEPFQFEKDVPELIKNKTSHCHIANNIDKININSQLESNVSGKTFERKLERNNNSDLHYLCTPVSRTLCSASVKKSIKSNKTVANDSSSRHPQHHHHHPNPDSVARNNNNNNSLNNNNSSTDKFSNIVLGHHSSTDSDFESLTSTPSGDEQQRTYLQISDRNRKLISTNKFDNNMKMSRNSLREIKTDKSDNNEKVLSHRHSSPSGRVRALIEKLETEKSTNLNRQNNNVLQELPKLKNTPCKNNNNDKVKIIDSSESENVDTVDGKKSFIHDSKFLEILSKQLTLDTESDTYELSDDKAEDKKYYQAKEKRDQLSRNLSRKHKLYVKRVSSLVDRYAKVISQTDCSPHLFESCILVSLNMSTRTPYIKYKYPKNIDVPHWIESLCFPDADHWNQSLNSKEYGGTYSLVLTNENGDRRFAFCRRVLPEGEQIFLPLVYCVISPFRATGFFHQILEEIESRHGLPQLVFDYFLQELYNTPFPKPDTTVYVKCHKAEVKDDYQFTDSDASEKIVDSGNFSDIQTDICSKIDLKKTFSRSNSVPLIKLNKTSVDAKQCEIVLTRPLDSRIVEQNLALLIETLNINIIIQIFGSLLLERKVVLICRTLSKLSACMEALQSMLYPFSWQHTFINILPSTLMDVLSAPTPFLIGVLTEACAHVNVDIEDGIVINLDDGHIVRCVGDEHSIIPQRIRHFLKAALTSDEIKHSDNINTKNVLISEAFIGAFLHLCGTYKHFVVKKDDKLIFEKESFIKSTTSKSIHMFLEWFTETAMFNAFMDTQIYPTKILYSSITDIMFCISEKIYKK